MDAVPVEMIVSMIEQLGDAFVTMDSLKLMANAEEM